MAAPVSAALITQFTMDLAELLFQNSDFMNLSLNHDNEITGSVVKIPYEAASGYISVSENPTGTNSIAGRSDDFLSYNISDFQTNSTRITIKTEMQSNYSLRQTSILSHGNYLSEHLGNVCLYNWGIGVNNQTLGLTGGGAIPTTGATSSSDANLPSSGTGYRRPLKANDLLKAANHLDQQLAPEFDRWALLPSTMYNELLNTTHNALITTVDYVDEKGQVTGKVPMLYGIKILKRRDVLIANGSTKVLSAPSGWSTAAASTKSMAGLVWSASTVCKAFGGQEVNISEKDPIYWGHTYINARALFGSTFARQDGVGVCYIYQAIG